MAVVVNRTTVEGIGGVNKANYPLEGWLHNPDLSALQDVDSKYWKVTGETVVEMTQAEKDAADLADLPNRKTGRIGTLDAQFGTYRNVRGYVADVREDLAGIMASAGFVGLPNRCNYLQDWHDWHDDVLSERDTAAAAIDAAVTVAAVDAVSWDFNQYTATDPAATIAGALAIPD